MKKVNIFFPLAPFTFEIAFSSKNQACGPETRAFRGKSIGGKKLSPGDPPVLPQNGAGPSGVSQFGILWFFFSILHSAFYISYLARPPGPRNDARLMVFARNALASGPGNA
jgi:hypothetical protein